MVLSRVAVFFPIKALMKRLAHDYGRSSGLLEVGFKPFFTIINMQCGIKRQSMYYLLPQRGSTLMCCSCTGKGWHVHLTLKMAYFVAQFHGLMPWGRLDRNTIGKPKGSKFWKSSELVSVISGYLEWNVGHYIVDHFKTCFGNCRFCGKWTTKNDLMMQIFTRSSHKRVFDQPGAILHLIFADFLFRIIHSENLELRSLWFEYFMAKLGTKPALD